MLVKLGKTLNSLCLLELGMPYKMRMTWKDFGNPLDCQCWKILAQMKRNGPVGLQLVRDEA